MKTRNLILWLTTLLFCVATAGGFSTSASSFKKANANSVVRSDNVQFSIATSSDDLNVYGTATLSENTPSGSSYRVTVTITSPSGAQIQHRAIGVMRP